MSNSDKEHKIKFTKSKIRKKAFARKILDIDDPETFGNQTQAAKAIYPLANRQTAANRGSALARDDYVMNEIERLLDQMGGGVQVRTRTLVQILSGERIRETITSRKNDKGEWVEYIKQQTPPTYAELIKVIDTLNKMDGLYRKSSTIVDEHMKMYRSLRKKVMDTMIKDREELQKMTVEHEPENEEKIDPDESSSELDTFLEGKGEENV